MARIFYSIFKIQGKLQVNRNPPNYLKMVFFLVFIIGSLIFTGCLKKYDNVGISSVDVMFSGQDDGINLTVAPYIQNNQNTDTGMITVKVKIRKPATDTIVAEKDLDIGYIKSTSSFYENISLIVPHPGEYEVEVQLFGGSDILSQNYPPVTSFTFSTSIYPSDGHIITQRYAPKSILS